MSKIHNYIMSNQKVGAVYFPSHTFISHQDCMNNDRLSHVHESKLKSQTNPTVIINIHQG
jgi:hypothetical protein